MLNGFDDFFHCSLDRVVDDHVVENAAFSPDGARLAFGLWMLYYRLTAGAVAATSVIFDAFCLIMGMQMLFFAMWMDMERNKGLK